MSSLKLNNVLGIDTSHDETVIGLNGKIVTWKSVRNQSKELLPKIDKLLKAKKIKPTKLRGIVVNIGPGSFTGLRVGITVANGFGYGLKIPVVGISEFEAIKTFYPKVDIIVLDAKRGELFIQARKSAPKLISANKLGDLIKIGTQVYVDDYRLIPIIHEQFKKAGTIYIPGLTRQQKMTALLEMADKQVSGLAGKLKDRTIKETGKLSQILPLYLRGANITRPRAKTQ